MNPYFSTPERQQQLKAEAERWLGTLFVPHARICGGGVDCVQLAAAIYIACGVIPSFDPGHYALQAGKHAHRSKVLDWLANNGWFAICDLPSAIAPGDLLCMQFRQRIVHHVGVALDADKFVHVLEHRAVEIGRIANFRHSIRAIYRPVAF